MARFSVLAVAAAFYLAGSGFASSQQIMVAEKKVAAVSTNQTTTKRRSPRITNGAHVYLLRGLLNIFSLGMDDLAQKLDHRGIATSVYNHTEWQSLSDEIATKYKAGNHGAIILIGHSLGADAVMYMGEYLGKKGVPVALIVPFDGTGSFSATPNVARVMNITQRDYAYMKRGPGFHGELANIDVSKDQNIGHVSIDKSARLHTLVINKIVGIVGGGRASPASASRATTPAKPVAAPATPKAVPNASAQAAPNASAQVAPAAAAATSGEKSQEKPAVH